jgi:hypothetical protein
VLEVEYGRSALVDGLRTDIQFGIEATRDARRDYSVDDPEEVREWMDNKNW